MHTLRVGRRRGTARRAGPLGVQVKILTGDNEIIAHTICRQVGGTTDDVLLGAAADKLTDEESSQRLETVTVCAKVSPAQKVRITEALHLAGHVVGFLGDDINDGPALKSADIGISVDTVVDIAKEFADIILLEKNLTVLSEGVLEGRKILTNNLLYDFSQTTGQDLVRAGAGECKARCYRRVGM